MADEPLNMSCGQTELAPECLKALGEQLVTPTYYRPYQELECETIQLIQELAHTKNDVLLIAGSATSGEEATMLTVLEPGDKILTVNTGTFGQVLTDLARVAGAIPIEIKVDMGRSVTPDQVRYWLERTPDVKMVAAVHMETTAGTVNPIAEIGEVLREYPQVLYMVDGVSSFGAMPTMIDDWGIDVFCTSSQKCLNAPQGLAIVIVSDKTWDVVGKREKDPPTVCLDLRVWKRHHEAVRAAVVSEGGTPKDVSFQESGRVAHGPSPSYVLVKGLHASLKALMAEGPERVFGRHRVAGKAVREAIRAMGVVKVLAEEEEAAPVATHLVFPEECPAGQVQLALYEKYKIAIGGNRIGGMGLAARPERILRVIKALGEVLKEMGQNVRVDEAYEAALQVFKDAGMDVGREGSTV